MLWVRIFFDLNRIKGSINLYGATFDDIILKDYRSTVEKNSKPVKNLYARLGNKSPNFCYAGHLDVVPAGNLKDWTVNPFKPSIKKGHLIGRGANDMKSSIAAFVSAVSNFIENYSNFRESGKIPDFLNTK